jgi:hypothetical protein
MSLNLNGPAATSTDAQPTSGVTVRRYYQGAMFLGADVYVGGWRSNRSRLVTERGITNAVAHHAEYGAECAARLAAANAA